MGAWKCCWTVERLQCASLETAGQGCAPALRASQVRFCLCVETCTIMSRPNVRTEATGCFPNADACAG